MNVTVNQSVSAWMGKQTTDVKNMYNTKCGEAVANDLRTWRNVGKGVYDFRASGNYRVVATKTGGQQANDGDTFNVAAIYKHANKGKKKLVGATVASY
jgi:hypothetical protein